MTAIPPVPIYLVDAFTALPFKGNPAGICLLSDHYQSWEQVDDRWLQSVALEMNQAETAFLIHSHQPVTHTLTPLPSGLGHVSTTDVTDPLHSEYLLRWFTPASEVDMCGHATLASAHLLYHSKRVPLNHSIHFHTRSGRLVARLVIDTSDNERHDAPPVPKTGTVPMIELDFPSDVPTLVDPASAEYQSLAPQFDRCFASIGGLSAIISLYKGKFDYVCVLKSISEVKNVRPDFGAMKAIQTRGVSVTSLVQDSEREAASVDNTSIDFYSRLFAPALMIDEDPVTGSAHCLLACLWGEVTGKSEMVGYQASARGGVVRVKREGDRVKLRGTGRVTVSGELVATSLC